MTATTRQDAVRNIATDVVCELPDTRTSPSGLPGSFGSLVFNDKVQRQRLPGPTYKALRRVIETAAALEPEIADAVASAMKDWAIEHGATHYTHWFQPMTGFTAEKHDSFLEPTSDGGAILEFRGKQLFQGEPDASSFPSGGLRATFEARGYTAWDPTSPAFIRKTADGATLTIPTAFCSWTGAALDKKTPLLRAAQAVSRAATRLLNLIGEEQVTRVTPYAGVEQEYFLLDRQFFVLRPDMMCTGRSLFGAPPPKGQEFDDHYFGTISQRVLAFMMDLEQELWQLGIPIKTRHNEVAPSQFELAPVYSAMSLSCDQNMLTMAVLREVAERHGLTALMHEKPYAGLNGSGKHLNWSLGDNLGNNLFDPGTTPHENLKFVLFLTAVVRAVHTHQDLLRAAVTSAGNDHRLGANEAPPAIMSIFVGKELEDVVDALIEGRAPSQNGGMQPLKLGVQTLPDLPRDISDRNRTSPFAFTGDKFEFRAVASSQSVAYPCAFINTIMAESLDHLADQIQAAGGNKPEAIQRVVSESLKAHRQILFAGDNYSLEWHDEAARRGLMNRRSTPEALMAWSDETNLALFERYGVFSRDEALSRSNVLNDQYAGKVNVEANATRELATTMILPAAMAYQRQLAETIDAVEDVVPAEDLVPQRELVGRVTGLIGRLKRGIDALAQAQKDAHTSEGESATAAAFQASVLPAMAEVRAATDALEGLVDDNLWPLPKYREMLFVQ